MQTNESSVNYSIRVICDFAASEPRPLSAAAATRSVRLLLCFVSPLVVVVLLAIRARALDRRARALEAIGQTRDLSPELFELFILLGEFFPGP